ncbi:MAG: hypothetical protein LBT09_04435 [Planctomycetaceae bacterium]|nr:hypothetical protein [Planctomycetaceae bacterium]
MISKMLFCRFGLVFCVSCFVALFGCSSVGKFRKPDLTAWMPPGPVAKAQALWNPAVQTGEQPQRGFGGRVYFYDSEERRSIKVDGTIAVYAFDETNRKPNDNEPTRVYTFAKEDVKKSYAKSKLGHSYNLWIPWDTEGPDGESKKVSLIVRYIPDKGSSVISQQVTAYLAGNNTANQALAKNEQDDKTRPNTSNIEKTQRNVDWTLGNVGKTQGNIQQAAFSGTDKFVEAARQQPEKLPIQPESLPIRLNSYAEHLIETNNSRPQKMQTTTININTQPKRD